MKILKQTVEYVYMPKQTTCPACKTELEYDMFDTRYDLWFKTMIITCPVCKNNIQVKKIEPTIVDVKLNHPYPKGTKVNAFDKDGNKVNDRDLFVVNYDDEGKIYHLSVDSPDNLWTILAYPYNLKPAQ